MPRPSRPDPLSSRAAAPTAEPSGSFETLLDAPAAPSHAQRAERAGGPRSSDRSDRARLADDRNGDRVGTRSPSDAGGSPSSNDNNSTNPADLQTAPQAEDVRAGDQALATGQPVEIAAGAIAEPPPAAAALFAVITAAAV